MTLEQMLSFIKAKEWSVLFGDNSEFKASDSINFDVDVAGKKILKLRKNPGSGGGTIEYGPNYSFDAERQVLNKLVFCEEENFLQIDYSCEFGDHPHIVRFAFHLVPGKEFFVFFIRHPEAEGGHPHIHEHSQDDAFTHGGHGGGGKPK